MKTAGFKFGRAGGGKPRPLVGGDTPTPTPPPTFGSTTATWGSTTQQFGSTS